MHIGELVQCCLHVGALRQCCVDVGALVQCCVHVGALVQCCVRVGALVQSVDQYNNTALHIAARYGHELLINTLVQHGADSTK